MLRYTKLRELRPGRVGLYIRGGCFRVYDGVTTEQAMERGRAHVRRLVRTVTEDSERRSWATLEARQKGGRKGGKARRV